MVRILCIGDVHMGRIPTRIRERGDDARLLSTTHVWNSVVDLAIAERVDVVLVSGDLVDLENRYYEARIPIERGVAKLEAENIPVVAICGNHDAEILPTICDQIATGITLLGQKQIWEEWLWPNQENPRLAVHGWSFRTRTTNDNPLTSYALNRKAIPTIGLLHCDLDASNSDYAPVRFGQFASLSDGPDCWVLGHIHLPGDRAQSGQTPLLYTGSICGLDPGEEGPHGPWLLTIEAGAAPVFEHMPIAPVYYVSRAVNISNATSELEAGTLVQNAVRTWATAITSEPGGNKVKCIVVRISVVGETPPEWNLEGHLLRIAEDTTEIADVAVVIDRIENNTQLRLDLHELALSGDPPGLLARKLIALDSDADSAERDRLIRHARSVIGKATVDAFHGLDPLGDEAIAELMRSEANALLRALVSGRVGSVAAL